MAENFVEVVGSRLVGRDVAVIRVCRPEFGARSGVLARRSRPGHCAGGVSSGGEHDASASASVAVQGERVDHECVADEVQGLAVVADAMGAAEPEGVVEVAVD